MARNKNELPTIAFTISSNPEIVGYLDEMARMGFWGKNRSEVAERLVGDNIKQLVKEDGLNTLKRRKTSR